jgi:hypothetical protein
MQALLDELRSRWHSMFGALAAGADVPPGLRLRTEGMMEAAALLGFAAPAELQDLMDECYRSANGQDLADDLGHDWRDLFPFPQVPAMARRAPVYPSTAD